LIAAAGLTWTMLADDLYGITIGFALASTGFGLTRPGFTAGASLAVPLADGVPHAVAHSGPCDTGSHDGDEGHPALVGKDATEDECQLARKDEPDERGALQRGKREHDRQRSPGRKHQDVLGNSRDHQMTLCP